MDHLAMLESAANDPAVLLPPGASLAERVAGKTAGERAGLIARLIDHGINLGDWTHLARAGQLPPDGESWKTWLIMAGRGFGKTRAGAEWVRARAELDGRVRIALVAASMHEARAVMVEGESGLLAICPAHNRPVYESSNRRLIWPDGAQAFLYSAGEPESLRGAQHHFAWCDEIGKWTRGRAAWDNLEFGMRLGTHPRIVATTTPRPIELVKRVHADTSTATTRGRTADNAAHLAPSFIASLTERHAGTLTGRQELDGELIEDVEGALWSRAAIEAARVAMAPELTRVVIGVDPPAGASDRSDACGIVVTGLGADGHGYVLADATVKGLSPEGWARAVAAAAARWGADRIIVEGNNGGAMVESVLRAIDAVLPITIVHARQGKVARAEPVQALYAAGRVFHAGAFQDLEDEMCGLMTGGAYEGPGRSPDRADALVWALHALLLGVRRAGPAKEVTHNEALTLIDIAIGATAETIGDNAPPPAPAIGRSWIVGPAPTGEWAGHAQALAGWTAGGWRFLPPVAGMQVWIEALGGTVRYGPSGWGGGAIEGTALRIGGQQVVGPRRPAIAPPSGGMTIDSEARATLATVLSMLQSHGLIAA